MIIIQVGWVDKHLNSGFESFQLQIDVQSSFIYSSTSTQQSKRFVDGDGNDEGDTENDALTVDYVDDGVGDVVEILVA